MISNSDAWLGDQCLQILGQKDKGTVQYLKSLAKKSKNLNQLMNGLSDFDIPTNDNPRNQHFASQLFIKYGSGGRIQKSQPTTNQTKRANEYGLVNMNLNNKKIFTNDKQAISVKDKQMLRQKDITQRDQFSKRLIQKQKMAKQINNSAKKKNIKGVTYTQQQKQFILPQLRKESRLKYLDKRQKQKMKQFQKIVQDDKQIFGQEQLTAKQIRNRQLKQRIVRLAKGNIVNQQKIQGYRPPQSYDDNQNNKPANKDKRMKALYGRYQDVPNLPSDNKLWQSAQGDRTKGTHRTIDQLEMKYQKNYDVILNNPVNFVKTEIINKMKNIKMMEEKLQILKKIEEGENSSQQGSSSGSSGSSGSSDSSSSSSRQKQNSQKSKKKKQKKEKVKKQEQEKPKKIQRQILTPMQKTKRSLPIYKYKQQLLSLIRDNQVIIMVGQTGSGKTTQLPQYLHQIGYTRGGKKIGCTQPRRVAAMSVATRVAQQMNVKIGQQVGYSIRFQDNTNQNTIIKYMTDGMLLRQFMIQPDLDSYSVMIIDQAHQRSLHTDILLTLVKDLSAQRQDLKIIISSATLQAQKFSNYFNGAPIIKIPGRRFPVDIYYTEKPQASYIQATIVTVLQIHLTQDPGDILCFLTGQDQIQQAMQGINNRMKGLGSKVKQLLVLPIYAGLPSDMQAKIFEPTPPKARKVVLATNIAQTSLTIDNIIYVIDSGFVKQTAYNPRTGMDSLIVTPISKASANQRAGRAGRVAPGKCFRLYTLWSYQKQLQESTIPQIQRSNIGNVVLMLKSMGIDNLVQFDFLDPPPHDMLVRALQMLYALGALNDRGQLTKLGRRMAQFPLDPMLSKILIKSQQFKCVDQMITICAMLSIGNSVFYRPKDRIMHADNARRAFFRVGGDHLALLNVFNQWKQYNQSAQWCTQNFLQIRSLRRARDIKQQLISIMQKVQIDPNDQQLSIYQDDQNTNIRKCIITGFFMHCARKQKNSIYKTAKYNLPVKIHPSSLLHRDQPDCVVYHQLVLTTQQFMRNIIEVQPEWLIEIAPHFYKMDDFKGLQKKMKQRMQMQQIQ